MDRLESLGNTLSQITLYDIKSMYNQAKNVVLNVSEMEAKVREATNDEPWGASSTLMQEIAQGTFNFQSFNEIMPCVYARFMEKEAKQWRQIYKALQLLEYLIKHGSERVVDDARSHISTIKMLRNFYYVDEKGKDQGLNVRNRSRELTELLSDVEKIRTERRKAKANRNKYVGTGNDAMSFASGGSRYGGFGSEGLGYGDGGSGSGGGGGSGNWRGGDFTSSYSGEGGSSGFRDEATTPRRFQEYDAGDDDNAPRRSNSVRLGDNSSRARQSTAASSPVTPLPKQKEPVVDLIGMDDDDFTSPIAPSSSNKDLPAVVPIQTTTADDDFDDFIAAPPSAGPSSSANQFTAAPAPPVLTPSLQPTLQPTKSFSPPPAQSQQPGSGLFDILNRTSTGPTAGRPLVTSPTFTAQSALMPTPLSPTSRTTTSSSITGVAPGSIGIGSGAGAGAQHKKTGSSANFDDLWSMSLGSKPASSTPTAAPKSIKDLEKEKAQAGIWGAQKPPTSVGFGAFAAASPSTTAPPSNGGGLDDLLL